MVRPRLLAMGINDGRAEEKLVRVDPGTREFGRDRGLFEVSDDFDAPLPGDVLEAVEQ